MSMQKTLHIPCDGFQLTGTLHLPDRPSPGVVIGCHGLLADRRSAKQIALAETLNRIGIAYLRFDHRGCGDSQGHLELNALLPARCRDLYHAIDFMQSHSTVGALIGLFGSSFGGTVVLATAADIDVPAIVTYGAPINSHAVGVAAEKQIRDHHAISENDLSGFAFDISDQMRSLKNILIMQGENDEVVPSHHAHAIYKAAQEPKKIICFEKGDHRMSNAGHQRRFLDACAAWFKPFS